MKSRTWIWLILATGAAVLVAVGWTVYEGLQRNRFPTGIAVASGRIEARLARIAAATSGRILRLGVREGDRVKPGELIAQLDDRGPAAMVGEAEAAWAGARAEVQAADRHVAALESQLDLARIEAERYRNLYARDAVARQLVDQAESAVQRLESEVLAGRAAEELARQQTEVARARLDAARLILEHTSLTAPIAGVVEEVLARTGEIVAAGQPIVTVRRTEDVKLRVYLPLEHAEHVTPGMEARVFLNAFPTRYFSGEVERVASDAEFTPRDIHMPEERSSLVFAVDLRVPNAEGILKDGFPADAYIRWDSSARWPEDPPW